MGPHPRLRAGAIAAIVLVAAGGTATATHFAHDTEGHSTVEQTIVPINADPGKDGFTYLKTGAGEPYLVREAGGAKALADRDKRRVSLAYMSQMTDFQLADEESPARVEFVDPGPSSAWRPQEPFTPFQVEATIRQINHFAPASPVQQGDGTRNAMDLALITGDQADNQHLNETTWVRDLLEGLAGPTSFNSGLSDPADYGNPASLGASCAAFFAQQGGSGANAAAEGARYTGVQDYDDYPAGAPITPLYYDPDEPKGAFAKWPTYKGLLDRAQQIVIDPEGLKVPFYITNGNHDVLVQGNEDANQALEDIATGCFKALGSTNDPTSPAPPDGPDPNPLLSPLSVGMLVPPDPRRQFVSKVQIKEIYGATDEGEGDDDHGFAHVDPTENEESRFSASYYAWDPPQTPGMRFISIDTNSEGGQTAESFVPGQPSTPGSSNGNLDDPQFQWLKRELTAAKARNQLVVIFGHHPVRSMNTQVRDEQAVACSPEEVPVNDEHGHDVNPGCDLDPRPSDDDPDTPGVGCIHNGRDDQNTTCPGGHESFVDLIDQFPNVAMYVPGHTHEHHLQAFPRSDGSAWWEINTSAVIDFPNQSRLVELMDNRDGTLSIFNTVVDHASPATAPAACTADDCAKSFTEPQLASIGRTLTYNDPDTDTAAAGDPEDRNAELLMGDPRPVADLSVVQADTPDPVVPGAPLKYTATVTNLGSNPSHDTRLVSDLSGDLTVARVEPSAGECSTSGKRVECNLGTLAGAGVASVVIEVSPGSPGEVSSAVRVGGNVSDRQAGNDAAVERTTVVASVAPTPTASPGPTASATPAPPLGQTPLKPFEYELPPEGCKPGAALSGLRARRRRGRGVTLGFRRAAGASTVAVDLFQTSIGRRVIGERLVARYTGRRGPLTFNRRTDRRGRRLRDGIYFARFRARDALGLPDVRRVVLRRSRGRWSPRPAFDRVDSCGLLSSFKLERPVFGGTTRRGLRMTYRLSAPATVRVDILRGRRVVKRIASVSRRGGVTFRTSIDRALRRRGDYRVRITVRRGTRTVVQTLTSRRL
jgi:hypothetical protein